MSSSVTLGGSVGGWVGVERNIGFLCTIYVPPGLRGLMS